MEVFWNITFQYLCVPSSCLLCILLCVAELWLQSSKQRRKREHRVLSGDTRPANRSVFWARAWPARTSANWYDPKPSEPRQNRLRTNQRSRGRPTEYREEITVETEKGIEMILIMGCGTLEMLYVFFFPPSESTQVWKGCCFAVRLVRLVISKISCSTESLGGSVRYRRKRKNDGQCDSGIIFQFCRVQYLEKARRNLISFGYWRGIF